MVLTIVPSGLAPPTGRRLVPSTERVLRYTSLTLLFPRGTVATLGIVKDRARRLVANLVADVLYYRVNIPVSRSLSRYLKKEIKKLAEDTAQFLRSDFIALLPPMIIVVTRAPIAKAGPSNASLTNLRLSMRPKREKLKIPLQFWKTPRMSR